MTDTNSHSTVLLPVIKHTSRFTEHFDLVPPSTVFEPFALESSHTSTYDIKPQRSLSISASRPFTFAKPVRMHSSPAITTNTIVDSASSISHSPSTQSPDTAANLMPGGGTYHVDSPSHSGNNHDGSTVLETPQLSSSTSTSIQHQRKTRKTVQQQPVSLLYKDYASSSTSFNRADIMIKRLCNWIVFLKLVTGWVDEIVKMTGSSALKKQKKEHPELYDQINKKRKKCQGIISSFKKECRDKLHGLKINPALNTEELLLRAKETRKRMAHLTKLCDYVGPSSPEMDPWLANLQVLRYLRRETAEENRLRELMVPIQQDMKDLELRLVDSFADVIDFCVEQQTTVVQYGSTLDQVLGNFLPQYTWQAFVSAQQKEWVDENHIRKNHKHINYPNKQHTHVATAQKGVLGRRSGVLKHYHDKYYVLTHYGYLHQFKLDDMTKPEDSIYVATSTTIHPEINDNDGHLFDELGSATDGLENTGKTNGYTFEINYKRKKTFHFKTSTGKELVSWCRALTHVANGTSVEKLLIQRKQKHATTTSNYPTNNLGNNNYKHEIKNDSNFNGPMFARQQQLQQQSDFQRNDENNSSDNEDDDNMSQFHSCHFSDNDSVSRTELVESDIMSIDDVVDPDRPPVQMPVQQLTSTDNGSFIINQCQQNTTSSTTTNYHLQQQLLLHNSGIYSSSPSPPASLSSLSLSSASVVMTTEIASPTMTPLVVPPAPDLSIPSAPTSRRGIPTYQANLNIMATTTTDHYP